MPLFSIITPVLNRAADLPKTLASVLSQPSELYEYLVMDGGSTDGTLDLLRAQTGIRWVSEPDGGVYHAMNKGLELATGEFVYFLGAGDTLRENILEAVAAVIPHRSNTFFYGNVYSQAHGRVYNGRYSRWKLSRINICHQSVFCHRRLFEMSGRFDTRYPIMADHVWNMKCFGDKRIHKVYADLVVANYAAGGLSHFSPDPQLLADRLALIKTHLGPLPYALNLFAALLPAGLKEARYQAFGAIKAGARKLVQSRADANRH